MKVINFDRCELADTLQKRSEEDRQRIQKIIKKIDETRNIGWWDSTEVYEFVNRNIISRAQRDTMAYMVQALCKHLGVGIGVGGTPIANVLSVNTKECDVIVTDYHLPFEDESVGYIISNHTLEHIPETDETLQEWARVLKTDGLISITMPDKRYFLHQNEEGISKYDYAYCEMDPSELKIHLEKISDKLELLLFNTNNNNFDMNVLLRKKGVTK
jgi:SAM-dependent methyltransferase